MSYLLTLIASFILWIVQRVGFRVAYFATIIGAMMVVYLAGWAVLYLAFKALIAIAGAWWQPPPIAQMMFYFMPDTSATSLCFSMVIGSQVIAANFRAWFYQFQLAAQGALNV